MPLPNQTGVQRNSRRVVAAPLQGEKIRAMGEAVETAKAAATELYKEAKFSPSPAPLPRAAFRGRADAWRAPSRLCLFRAGLTAAGRYEEAAVKYSEALGLMPEMDPDDDDEIEAGKDSLSPFVSRVRAAWRRCACCDSVWKSVARGTPEAKLRAVLLSNRAQVRFPPSTLCNALGALLNSAEAGPMPCSAT